MKPWFFVTFNIIISYIFAESFIEIARVGKLVTNTLSAGHASTIFILYFYWWRKHAHTGKIVEFDFPQKLSLRTKDKFQLAHFFGRHFTLHLTFGILHLRVVADQFCPLISLRDDTHMTSMSIYVQNSSTPLTLDVQFQGNPFPPLPFNQLSSQSVKRKHNRRMTIINYQIHP